MIEFKITGNFKMQADEFINEIFVAENWSEFKGYGILPGVKHVEIRDYSKSKVGTKFNVTNTDNSRHIETVVEYIPNKLLVLKFSDFTKPLSNYVSHFIETYKFDRVKNKTHLERTFQMYPLNVSGKIMLYMIKYFMKKAIRKHMDGIILKDNNRN